MGAVDFRRLLHALIAGLSLVAYPLALPAGTLEQGGGYELRAQVVGAGGTTMQGSGWTLDGTVAQTDAFVQNGAGGVRLEGGFWQVAQAAFVSDRIFANGFDPAADGVAAAEAGRFTPNGAIADDRNDTGAQLLGIAQFASVRISGNGSK